MNQIRTARRGFLKAGAALKFLSGNMSMIYFLFLVGMAFITNAHWAEKRMRNIQVMKEEIKELRWEYMTVKSDLMYSSTYSQVAKGVADRELQFCQKVPRKIIVR